jgi:predicted lipoprotein
MKKRMLALGLAAAMTAFTMTGCVKVVKIGEEAQYTGKTEFNAGDNVAEIWESQAVPELQEKAVELADFLKEANGDLKSLVDQYGKYSMGTSGEINYVVKGTGTVTEVNQEKKAGYMTVKLEGYDGTLEISIQIGSVYKGSSIRDSLDIIKFGDYTNQQDWAAVSQSINKVVDEQVVRPADPASLKDKTISFTGCFTANDNTKILITPVEMEVK